MEDLEDPVARANFRVVIIKPEIMESVDLSDPAKARRQVYKFDESNGQWTHTECWPCAGFGIRYLRVPRKPRRFP